MVEMGNLGGIFPVKFDIIATNDTHERAALHMPGL